MGARMLSSNPARLDSPDLVRPLGDARRILAGADGRADGHGLAHGEINLHRRFGGTGGALQFVDDERRASASTATASSPLMTLSICSSPTAAAATSAATMRLPRSLVRNACDLGHRRRIEIVRQRPQRRRLEHIDAKTALGGRRHRRELLLGKLRGHIAGEQLADLLRHRAQGGAHLFAYLRPPGRSSPPCRYRRSTPPRKRYSPTATAPRNDPCTNSK